MASRLAREDALGGRATATARHLLGVAVGPRHPVRTEVAGVLGVLGLLARSRANQAPAVDHQLGRRAELVVSLLIALGRTHDRRLRRLSHLLVEEISHRSHVLLMNKVGGARMPGK